MDNFQHTLQTLAAALFSGNFAEFSTGTITTFTLIAAAEMGDKSQLVCMTLAARHRPWPIVFGAVAAFGLLNTLAVIFGAAIASWLPEYLVALAVALLFAIFGIHALQRVEEDDDEEIKEKSGHGIFFTTFVLITVAEFGDKTQLAVVALGSTVQPIAVWLGATAALSLTSALGVLAGQTVLQKIPLLLLHRLSGAFFLMLAVFAGYKAYLSYTAAFKLNNLTELLTHLQSLM
ncbi:MAG: hypothetical protein CVV13_13435 [Gammaproteobacteria bacterium HGW-Gammaproteobacteria-3]|nr:MAG: hypothetical protein CVV13_13435 [Gammaproteobacteria bacterium HGW-Gammaproteobacteria-3]